MSDDRLGALAPQARVLTLHVNLKIRLRIAPSKAIRELRQIPVQSAPSLSNLSDIHTRTSVKERKSLP